VITILFSAILLIGAIATLTAVNSSSRWVKIEMIMGFTLLFAASVGILTNARRAEIFGSTAAYAAVLVVFVSNPL
jgi:Co/Zn/Cd efflux system component